ncbi:Mitochondrial carrier like protein 2 [Eufriesea mexicana]|uniref:Mitochondrial carrier like protein 2 n=1 Tax=Eufriesea mexicana TaxID=516756 RepID=A0A310SM37_9HYME|nr:Mitochondrial carrier like protein 2 [Eufriesea mexicana]
MIPPKDKPLWCDIAFRMLMNTVSYPIEYGKVLIQIGYEPIPPRPTTTLFGKPALALPNIFQYVIYIKNVDGFTGCYRGLIPKLCAYTVSATAFEKTSKSIKFKDEPSKDDLEESQKRKKCIYEFIRDLISRMIGIIISHPLDVIALRMMAQFVGGETKYNGLFRSFVEVYKANGIMGYYAGLLPRLIGNAAGLVIVSSSTYAIDKFIKNDRELRPYAFIATTITYPFLVISHCMAVNNCGLIAGLPPQMPIYNSWLDCLSHLWSTNQLKRGNSLLWRYYTGPQVLINGKLIPLNKYNFHLQSTT